MNINKIINRKISAKHIITRLKQKSSSHGIDEVTFVRALGSLESDLQVRCPDILASYFLPTKFYFLQRPHKIIKAIVNSRMPGGYWYHNARTQHIDNLLIEELKNGATQLLILGSGNDSRGYRFDHLLKNVNVYELDLFEPQNRKKDTLLQMYGEIPTHVNFIPIDFKTEEIHEKLKETNFDSTKKTFVIWEGG